MGCYVTKKVKQNIEDQVNIFKQLQPGQEQKLQQLTQQNKELLDQVNQLKKQHENRKPLYLVKDQELDDLNVFKTDLDRRFLKLKEHIEMLNRENGISSNQLLMNQPGQGLGSSHAPMIENGPKPNPINEDEWKKIVESKHDFIIMPFENFDLSKVDINIQLSQKKLDQDDSKKEKLKATDDKIEKQEQIQDLQEPLEDQLEQQMKKSENKFEEEEKFNQVVQEPQEINQFEIKNLEEVKIEVIQEEINESNFQESKKQLDQDRPRSRRTPEQIDNELQAVMQDPKLNLVHEQVKNKMFKEKEKNKLYKTTNENKEGASQAEVAQMKTDPVAIKQNLEKLKQQQQQPKPGQKGQRQSLFLAAPNKQTPKTIERKTSKSPTVQIAKGKFQ